MYQIYKNTLIRKKVGPLNKSPFFQTNSVPKVMTKSLNERYTVSKRTYNTCQASKVARLSELSQGEENCVRQLTYTRNENKQIEKKSA